MPTTCEQDTGNQSASTLLREALAPSSNFIVLVMEAIYLNDDFKQKRDHWFNLIRNYDSNLERTMVVFTKCDVLPNNFNYNKIKAFLRESNDFVLRLISWLILSLLTMHEWKENISVIIKRSGI